MTVAVEVRDDPDHPEGGHALVLFRGTAKPDVPATLVIEPLTEGFDYRGPRRLKAEGRATPEGFEIPVGPDVLAALPPGIAVSLGLAGSGREADIRWPTLAQKAAEPRRQAIKAPTRRVVVTGGGASLKTSSAAPKRQDPPDGASDAPKPQDEPDRGDTPRDGGASNATVGGAGGASGTVVALQPPADPAKPPILDVPPVRAGWRTGSVAAAALLAFLAGAGGVGTAWFLRAPPPPPSTVVGPTLAALPSPYDMLNELTDHSPRGIHVDPREAKGFRLRGDGAETPQEARFWHGWAARDVLTAKNNDVAATLSDWATDLARGDGAKSPADAPALAAARFLWEMAALASDCSAMENIAAALSRDGQAGTGRQAAVWRDRATLCRAGSKVAR